MIPRTFPITDRLLSEAASRQANALPHESGCETVPADGDNLVDSGTPSQMFPTRDRVRFPFRCARANAASWCEQPEQAMAPRSCAWCMCWRRLMSPHTARGPTAVADPARKRLASLCRVTAVGNGWIDIDRPLPIELRPAWTVRLKTGVVLPVGVREAWQHALLLPSCRLMGGPLAGLLCHLCACALHCCSPSSFPSPPAHPIAAWSTSRFGSSGTPTT